MAIHIDLDYAEIPVTIGDLSFNVSIDDDSYKELRDISLEALSACENAEDFDEMKEAVRPAYDEILGDGSFDLIFEKVKMAPIMVAILRDLYVSVENEYHRKIQRNHSVKKKNVQHHKQPRK